MTEEERFGSKVGRIDVPRAEDPCPDCSGKGVVLPFDSGSSVCPGCEGKGHTGGGFTTVYFGGTSIYCLTPTTERLARAAAVRSQPEPVHQYELPAPKPVTARESRYTGDFDPDDDDDDEVRHDRSF